MISVLLSSGKVLAQTTELGADPAVTQVTDTYLPFQVNITVTQITDLAGWDFKLYYPNWLLNASNIVEGPFLKMAGATDFLKFNFTDSYNATCGLIWAVCLLEGQGAGASGSGTLATITFEAVSGGNGTLHLADTDMVDSQMPPNHISHDTSDGIVRVLAGIKDVAITNIIPTKTILGMDYSSNIKVTAKNEGTNGASFVVSLNATKLLTRTVSYTLFGSGSLGWGFARNNMSIPGPTLVVHKGDDIKFTLTSADLQTYNFFVDYNGDKLPNGDEPKSPDFCGPPYYWPTINFEFTAGRTGTFTYYCKYDESTMYGSIIMQPTPTSTTEIGRQTVLLGSGASANVTFVWDTHGYSKGLYNLTAYARPLLGETHVSDNLFVYGSVKLTILGDVNGDYMVDISDGAQIGLNWLKTVPPAPANVDINGDGVVDISDGAILGLNWLKDP